MRTRITLECTECKQRNYNMTKDKKSHPERMETKKYCRFCKKHTLHKEFKKIVWPDKMTVAKETAAVVSVSVVLGAIIAVVDFFAQYGVDLLIK